MIQLASPWALIGLPLGGLVWWASRRWGQEEPRALGFSALALVARAAGPPARRARLPLSSFGLSLLFLVLALARPQWSTAAPPDPARGLDIMLCLDTSPSMQAPDIQPNRMTAAREVSLRFVQGRSQDRIGVVVFSGIAFTQCPLTVDHEALSRLLEQVRVGITRTDGTAVGLGLLTAVNRLKGVPGEGRVVILLTDGRSNAGEVDPLTAARLAAELGIKVYTIGVGTRRGGAFQMEDELGFGRSVAVDVDLDEGTLREMASLTGGRYFRATDSRSLAEIYAEIDRLETREGPGEVAREVRDLHLWLLLPGLALWSLGLLLEQTLSLELP